MTPITPHNVLRHELIGLPVRVSGVSLANLRPIRGTVIDETRNTLKIRTTRKTLVVPKDTTTFRFELPDGVLVDVDGKRLVARPENRLKARVKRW